MLIAAALTATAGAGAWSPAYGESRSVVLLELFTSQGCSSCPPADRLLAELGGQDGIVALSFHVDYWDDLGWKDPFSSERWTARQRRYAQVMGDGRVYTPQLVIQGREHVVGSDRRGAAAAIRRARAASARIGAPVTVTATARLDGEAGRVHVAALVRGKGGEVWAALVERRRETRVPRGENGGRELANDFVVRRLERVTGGKASLRVERGWRPGRLAVVVFVQASDDLGVRAATLASVD